MCDVRKLTRALSLHAVSLQLPRGDLAASLVPGQAFVALKSYCPGVGVGGSEPYKRNGCKSVDQMYIEFDSYRLVQAIRVSSALLTLRAAWCSLVGQCRRHCGRWSPFRLHSSCVCERWLRPGLAAFEAAHI
jgi:hypothetical protein